MRKKIEQIIDESVEKNHFWNSPLTAYAGAGNEQFHKLRESVSPTHAMPMELLPGAASVISFFIPFKSEFAQMNNQPGPASETWAKMYIETNELIKEISLNLNSFFNLQNADSFIFPATHNFDKEKLISDWSHRHIAEICGLGKFGINNMLITRVGCSGRFGSIITTLELDIKEIELPELCLYKESGTCGICVDKCENGALTLDSFDRYRCHEVCLKNAELYKGIGKADVCGKCLISLPCSHKSPVKF